MRILEATRLIGNADDAFSVRPDAAPVDYFLHGHDFIEIAIVKNGYGVNIINGTARFVTKGDFFVIKPNVLHYYRNIKELELINIILTEDKRFTFIKNLEQLIDDIESKTPDSFLYQNLNEKKLENVLDICCKLSSEKINKNNKHNNVDREILFFKLILILSQVFNLDEKNRELTIIENIYNNLNGQICWDSLSAEISVPKRSMYRLIKQRWKCTPSKLVSILRAVRAHEYIRTTDLDISEVAILSGFKCSSQLSNEYKHVFNVSPSHERYNI